MAANKGTCKATGCDREVYAKDLCSKHYNQVRLNGRLIPERERRTYSDNETTCEEHGCDRPIIAKGLCMTHYQALRRSMEAGAQIEANQEVREAPVKRRRVVRRRA